MGKDRRVAGFEGLDSSTHETQVQRFVHKAAVASIYAPTTGTTSAATTPSRPMSR
jgi:hypothetical protein